MAKRVKATRTINPLHFEDLEPHRFEDLVRRLLYSFRDWTNIEATGRGGSDEGFDVRAWERGETVTNIGEEGNEGVRDLDGRLWQIQGKREKIITPAKIRAIINDGVDGKTPPYGYILAAATNISKTAYDAFRRELRKKGVTELYFWGKDYLEDQLVLPQNDEILFTFFGLSLSPKRRSRVSEIKFGINNKNKILKLIFDGELRPEQAVPTGRTFLLRDIKADRYPDEKAYPDFAKSPKWVEVDAEHVDARGVHFRMRQWYASYDSEKKEWDYSTSVDLTNRKHSLDAANEARTNETGNRAERFWRHLRQRHQAKLCTYGYVPFEDMLIIDDRGDPEHTAPHLHIDFGQNGPFQYCGRYLVHRGQRIWDGEIEALTRAKVFPPEFPKEPSATVRNLASLDLPPAIAKNLSSLRGAGRLYDFGHGLAALQAGTLIRIVERNDRILDKDVEVTHIYRTTVQAILNEDGEFHRTELEAAAERAVAPDDIVTVYETHEVLRPFEGGGVAYLRTGWPD
jgi:hypothetical protein